MKKAWKLTTVAAVIAGMVSPGLAAAQNYEVRNYDGYCYVKQKDAKKNGMIIGAVVGGLLGTQISKNERGLGAIVGAVAGGALGRNIGKNSVKCYHGEYYSYQGRYYDPSPAPAGYVPVFFEQRPDSDMYSQVYYDRDRHSGPPPYNYAESWKGWRDSGGKWHDGQPPKGYWQDSHGYWHSKK